LIQLDRVKSVQAKLFETVTASRHRSRAWRLPTAFSTQHPNEFCLPIIYNY